MQKILHVSISFRPRKSHLVGMKSLLRTLPSVLDRASIVSAGECFFLHSRQSRRRGLPLRPREMRRCAYHIHFRSFDSRA